LAHELGKEKERERERESLYRRERKYIFGILIYMIVNIVTVKIL